MFKDRLAFEIAHDGMPIPDCLQVLARGVINRFKVVFGLADCDSVYDLIEIQIGKELGRGAYFIRHIALGFFNEYAVESHGVGIALVDESVSTDAFGTDIDSR